MQGAAGCVCAGRVVDVAGADALVPALELVVLGLFLFELGEGELLDLELVVDLGQELGGLARQFAVLLVACRVPRLDEPPGVAVGERYAAQSGQLPADFGDHVAQSVDGAGEVVGVGDGDDGLLEV